MFVTNAWKNDCAAQDSLTLEKTVKYCTVLYCTVRNCNIYDLTLIKLDLYFPPSFHY